MGHRRCRSFAAGQGGRERAINVAHDNDRIGGVAGLQHRFQAAPSLRAVCSAWSRSRPPDVIGCGTPSSPERWPTPPVVVLARVDEPRRRASRNSPPQGRDHRRRLDEVRPGADDVEEAHGAGGGTLSGGAAPGGRRRFGSIGGRMPKMKTHSAPRSASARPPVGAPRPSCVLEPTSQKKSPKRKRAFEAAR